MEKFIDLGHELHEGEQKLLDELRTLRRTLRMRREPPALARLTVGQRIADKVAATMGSWKFIIIQSAILLAWIILNVTAYVQRWDPYPFILLNLALSFQAAYAAPLPRAVSPAALEVTTPTSMPSGTRCWHSRLV